MRRLLVVFCLIIVVGTGCQSQDSSINAAQDTLRPDTVTVVSTTRNPTAVQASELPTYTLMPNTPTPSPPTPIPSTSTPYPPSPTQTHTPFPPTATARPAIDEEVSVVRAFLDDQANAGEFSGAVLIAQAGIPILQDAYGKADRSLNVPNQIDTKFNLGSMDKMFTAVAVMQLVERGEVSLHNEIQEYLPDFRVQEIADTVTVHDLLIHTSGLGNYFDSPLYLESYDRIRSIGDYFALFADLPPVLEVGSQFAYSNSGYIVLGMIIEAVSGQSYYDYVREHIFLPIGMNDTACYELDAGTPNLAIGYTKFDWDGNDTGEIHDNFSMLPMRGGSAGGGYSTAPDLLAFSNALLNYQLLNPESTELLLEGKIHLRNEAYYAYGFFDRIVNGYRMVGHGGGFPGICSMLNIYPELEYTIIILSNSDNGCLDVNPLIEEALLK